MKNLKLSAMPGIAAMPRIAIIALAVIIGFSLIGCDLSSGTRTVGGEEGPGGPEGPGDGFVSNLGAITIELTDNFEYGETYQATYQKADLFKGNKVTKGDKYTLKIAFTASRDFRDILYVGLVDGSEAAKYWTQLTYESGDDKNAEPINGAASDKIIKQGETVSATITMTAIESATSAAPNANMLVFYTKSDDGTKGQKNSGTLGKITLTFTEFIFAKGDITEVPPPPPPPPPPPQLPAGVISLSSYAKLYESDGTTFNGQIEWDLVSIVSDAGKWPKYLLVSTKAGTNGLGGIQVAFSSQGVNWWAQTDASPNWSFDQAWAAPAKVFIFDLSKCSGYGSLNDTDSKNSLILGVGTGTTSKLMEGNITGAAVVFEPSAGATATAALCIAANEVTNGSDPIVMWYVDENSLEDVFN